MRRSLAYLIDKHGALWSSDPWYRRSWMLWPQALSFLAIGMIWSSTPSPNGVTAVPWGKPSHVPTPAPASQAPSPAGQPPDTAATTQNKEASDTIMGKTFTKSMPAGGFIIPLPDGNWTVIATANVTEPGATGTGYFLARLQDGRLIGAARIIAADSKERPGAGFKLFTDCDNRNGNNIFTVNEGCTAFESQSFWRLHNYFSSFPQWADRTLPMGELDRLAGKMLTTNGIRYPQDFVAVQFVRAEKWGVLDTSYLFSPEDDGITAKQVSTFRESDWHSANITRFPDKMAYARKLKDWGASFWPKIKDAFAAGE